MGSAGKALPPPSLELDREIGLFYTIEEGRCPGPCKVSGPNRTKMFHVKHFGKVAPAGKQLRLVDLHGSYGKGRHGALFGYSPA
jgi:hypothetical protein